MKIRVIDRIVLFLLALVVLAIGVCAALNEFGISVVQMIPAGLLPQLSESVLFIVRIAAIAAVILISFYLFGISFRRKRKPDPFINMESGSKGSIRMSMDSISGLVLRTCGNIPGISALKVNTINHEDSVSVDMSFQVDIDRNIPELSGQIQQMVGEVVEKNCGVAVRNVCVTVSGFVTPKTPVALPESDKQQKKGIFARSKEEKIETSINEVEEAPAVPVAPVIVTEEIVYEETPVAEEIPAAETFTEKMAYEEAEAEEPVVVYVQAEAPAEEKPAEAPVVEAPAEDVPYQPDENDEYIPTENE